MTHTENKQLAAIYLSLLTIRMQDFAQQGSHGPQSLDLSNGG
jgi:hypothetical protein